VGGDLVERVDDVITGGCENKPVSTTVGRAIAIAWMLGGIVLVASFTATHGHDDGRAGGQLDPWAPRSAGPRCGLPSWERAGVGGAARRGIVQEYDTTEECLDALAHGMIDAIVGENQSLMYAISQPGQGGFRLIGAVFDAFDYGMVVATGSPLREQIDAASWRFVRMARSTGSANTGWAGTE